MCNFTQKIPNKKILFHLYLVSIGIMWMHTINIFLYKNKRKSNIIARMQYGKWSSVVYLSMHFVYT